MSQDCHQLYIKIYSFPNPLDATVSKPAFNAVFWRVETLKATHNIAIWDTVGDKCFTVIGFCHLIVTLLTHYCHITDTLPWSGRQTELLIRNLHFSG